jgi:hypothetical protein
MRQAKPRRVGYLRLCSISSVKIIPNNVQCAHLSGRALALRQSLEFERRQMAAVRKEPDQEYEAMSTSMQSLQRMPPRSEYPAEIRLDLWKRSGHVKVSRVTSTAKSRF